MNSTLIKFGTVAVTVGVAAGGMAVSSALSGGAGESALTDPDPTPACSEVVDPLESGDGTGNDADETEQVDPSSLTRLPSDSGSPSAA